MATTIHSIRYPFGIDQGLGTLSEESNYSLHVEQLMRQVLFTNPGERINRPDFGCGIPRMVFAPNSDVSANLAQVMINQALEKWLGSLIEVREVKAVNNEEKLEITIAYIIRARQERRYLNLEIPL